jgi:hypothetical protein
VDFVSGEATPLRCVLCRSDRAKDCCDFAENRAVLLEREAAPNRSALLCRSDHLGSRENPLLSSILEEEDAVGATKAVEVEAIRLDEPVRARLGACPGQVTIDTQVSDTGDSAGAQATLADACPCAIVIGLGLDRRLEGGFFCSG